MQLLREPLLEVPVADGEMFNDVGERDQTTPWVEPRTWTSPTKHAWCIFPGDQNACCFILQLSCSVAHPTLYLHLNPLSNTEGNALELTLRQLGLEFTVLSFSCDISPKSTKIWPPPSLMLNRS